MQYYDILRKPVLSEKSLKMEELSKYTFIVDKKSSKDTVKLAIENIFDVKVQKVNMLTIKGRARRFKGVMGRTSDYKKAVITLSDGQKIDLTGSIK